MKNRYHYYLLSFFTIVILTIACKAKEKKEGIKTGISSVWQIDFLDNFDTFKGIIGKISVFGLIMKLIVMCQIMNLEQEKLVVVP